MFIRSKTKEMWVIKISVKHEWRQRKPKRKYDQSDSIVSKLCAIHGIDDFKEFVNPTEKNLHSPHLLKNIHMARNRIVRAFNNEENIVFHGDIDSDGCNSTALGYNYSKKFTDKVTYIHAQRSKGHGAYNSLEDIPPETQLLIIVDSSSNEVETCRTIQERGIDIIILDHHEINKENPYCILVNPQQPGDEYPNKEISGSVVVWKMCQVIDEALGCDYAEDLVDLAGLGMHSDQMSMLQPENRYILKQSLNNVKNLGLQVVLTQAKKDLRNLKSSDYAFGVTNLINAATRLDKMEIIMRMLTSDDIEEVNELYHGLIHLNEQRKQKQKEALERIIPTIDESNRCIIVVDPSLGKNMNGLIASDLEAKYKRPVIVLGHSSENEDEYHGSFRSTGFFDFLSFADKIPCVLFTGGHAGAGGLGIKKNDLVLLQNELNKRLEKIEFEQVEYYDLVLNTKDITENLTKPIEEFNRLSGKHCKEAKFLIKNLYVQDVKTLGKQNDTLKAPCVDADDVWCIRNEDLKSMEPDIVCMKFRTTDEYIANFPVRKSIDVIGSININEWEKTWPKKQIIKTKQVFIDDYREV